MCGVTGSSEAGRGRGSILTNQVRQLGGNLFSTGFTSTMRPDIGDGIVRVKLIFGANSGRIFRSGIQSEKHLNSASPRRISVPTKGREKMTSSVAIPRI